MFFSFEAENFIFKLFYVLIKIIRNDNLAKIGAQRVKTRGLKSYIIPRHKLG